MQLQSYHKIDRVTQIDFSNPAGNVLIEFAKVLVLSAAEKRSSRHNLVNQSRFAIKAEH